MQQADRLLRAGIRLELATLGWNVVGAVVVFVAAFASGSVALAGFGLDTAIEIVASTVVIWHLRQVNARRERPAMLALAAAFAGLAVYVTAQAAYALVAGGVGGGSLARIETHRKEPAVNEPVRENQLLAVIEIPKGSRNKYEYDEELDRIVFDRFLSGSTLYPADYGYLEGYLGEDGDPLDCLVIVSEATFPGCVIPVKPVALFKMSDEKGADDKVICIPTREPRWSHVEDLDGVPGQLQEEVEHFFKVYKNLEGKPVETDGWRPRADAERTIADARSRHLAA